MKKTKSRGLKFLEHFIDLRVSDGYEFREHVMEYLSKHHKDVYKLASVNANLEVSGTLGDQFFSNFYSLDIGDVNNSKTVLVGKGVCFDTGGYDLKTNMEGMYYDRNGALLAIAASLDYGVPARVFFCTNTIHQNAPVHGQILTDPVSKQRVVISNTDAEGRIGLASILSTLKKKNKNVITMATLTGAAVQVTGQRTYAMLHANYKSAYPHIMKATLKGAKFWPAPFHEEYDKAVTTKIKGGDLDSCPKFGGAGSSTAFSFLKKFGPKGARMLHLDIAAMMTTPDGNGLIFGLEEVAQCIKIINTK
jgi:leucyl aminopeptidase